MIAGLVYASYGIIAVLAILAVALIYLTTRVL